MIECSSRTAFATLGFVILRQVFRLPPQNPGYHLSLNVCRIDPSSCGEPTAAILRNTVSPLDGISGDANDVKGLAIRSVFRTIAFIPVCVGG
jgi:hypothetical protein